MASLTKLVSSRPRDSSETFLLGKLVGHRVERDFVTSNNMKCGSESVVTSKRTKGYISVIFKLEFLVENDRGNLGMVTFKYWDELKGDCLPYFLAV